MIERLKAWFRREPEPEIPEHATEYAITDLKPEGKWRVGVTPEDIDKFKSQHGGRATAAIMGRLGKLQPNYALLTSPLGQILIGDIISEAGRLLVKIADNKASADEKAEYRAYVKIGMRHMELIKRYVIQAYKMKGVR